jgi:copper homeostasis protein
VPIDASTADGPRRRALLEVIVETVADARAAARGGADRLEVVRALEVGGLTPTLGLVREIAGATGLPLRVMVRGNSGFTTDFRERQELQRAAEAFVDAGVDGLVVGFARGAVAELEDLVHVVSVPGRARVTFHRAFDQLADPAGTIDALAGVGPVDRILTSGGDGVPAARCERLAAYQRRAGARLTIIAGGGVDEPMLVQIVRTRCVREVHVGRAARENLDQARPVSAERVARLIEMLEQDA